MLILKKIAVTGCIGSGKTTVCSYLKDQNFYLCDADKIGHDLLNKNNEKIIDLFGNEVVKDGQIDRKILATKVFNNKDKLKSLEELLHPQILREIEKQYETVKSDNYRYFLVDIALLFEMKHQAFYDWIIMIETTKDNGKKRFIEKGFASEDFEKRTANFLSKDMKKTHFVIENNKTIKDLYQQVDSVIDQIDSKN